MTGDDFEGTCDRCGRPATYWQASLSIPPMTRCPQHTPPEDCPQHDDDDHTDAWSTGYTAGAKDRSAELARDLYGLADLIREQHLAWEATYDNIRRAADHYAPDRPTRHHLPHPHRPFDSADDCCPDCAGICESCADEAPCRSARAADRAEARLWPVGHLHESEPPPERAILLDLIAELREPVRERAIRYDEELAALADRAEERLREVSDE